MSGKARCRGCGKTADVPEYCLGGPTPSGWKINYYGGFVCSPGCDFRSSLELEQSMPGHGPTQKTLGCFAESHHKKNWKQEART